MIIATVFDSANGVSVKPVVVGNLSDIKSTLMEGQKLWLDVSYYSDIEADDLIRVLGVHSDFLKSGYEHDAVEINGKYVFFTLRAIGKYDEKSDSYGVSEVKCFAFDDVAVTVCSSENKNRGKWVDDLCRMRSVYDDFACTFFMVVLNQISTKYLNAIEDIKVSLERIENRVENKNVSGVMASIKANKRKWSYIEYLVEDHCNHYHMAKFEDDVMPVKRISKVFSQVYSNMDFLAKQIDKLKELSKDIKYGHGVIMQDRSNMIVFILTLITGTFTIPNFIAALYNMQVKDVPLADTPNGFSILLGVMFIIFCITGLIGRSQYNKVTEE